MTIGAKKKDEWNSFNIGETKFQTIKHCTRCLLTTVNPDLGERDAKQEPLPTLRESVDEILEFLKYRFLK
jgi:uncharacterized protein YcbX